MTSAKDIRVVPISASDARNIVRRLHYSGKVAANSQLHFGVFLGGQLEGAMQFGPSLDKGRTVGLVAGTPWNGFLELNRLAFSDRLPRNSESRALGVAMRLIRKHAPHVQWVVSFADGTQCGDGTIYRAAGFVLTSIKKNTSIWQAPSGEVATDLSLRQAAYSRTTLTDARFPGSADRRRAAATISRTTVTKGAQALAGNGASSMRPFIEAGFRPLPGFQLRYVYFLDPSARERLSVPILPFSAIDEAGAGMYRGAKREQQAMAGHPPAQRRGGTDPRAPDAPEIG
jgi:hypothetical protein